MIFEIKSLKFDTIINLLSLIFSTTLSFIAVYISAKTLKQNNKLQKETQKANLEAQRANIVLSLDRTRTDIIFQVNSTIRISIKNYGSSPGTIRHIYTNPSIEELQDKLSKITSIELLSLYNKNLGLFNIKDTTLTPNQTLTTYVPLELFKDIPLEVIINYSSLNHDFKFEETIDLTYRENLCIENPIFRDSGNNKINESDATLKALKFIGESIREVSDKLS